MICTTCGVDPCLNPSFCRQCRDADARARTRGTNPDFERLRRLLDDEISLHQAYREIMAYWRARASRR
jgi:hypothetical protein